MERYRQRTIAELLKKTHKLNRPRMTPILEGKDRMRGPLDNLDNRVDFAAIQVCGICGNHLDASIAQTCSSCNKGYHSFCLEAPDRVAQDPTLLCCYYCQHQAAPDGSQLGSSPKNPLNKPSDDGMEIWRSSENTQDCDEPGTSYDTSEQSPATRKKDLVWSETSPSKRRADSGGTIFDTLHMPTKTRAARKLGIRRKRLPDAFGQEGGCTQILSSETGTSRSLIESSGIDGMQIDIAGPLVSGSRDVMPICPSADLEDVQDDNGGAMQVQRKNKKNQVDSAIGSSEQLVEDCVVSPKKDVEIIVEEVRTDDMLIKEGDVTGPDKRIVSQKLDATVNQAASGSACMPAENPLSDCSSKVSVMSEESLQKLQEGMRPVCALDSMDSGMGLHLSEETKDVVTKAVSEGNIVGEIQDSLQQQGIPTDELRKQEEDALRVQEKLISNALSDLDSLSQNTIEKVAHSPIPAIEAAKYKPSCIPLKGGHTEADKLKSFVTVKEALPSIQEETGEPQCNSLTIEDVPMEEALPSSSKGPVEVDSITDTEAVVTASLDSPNNRATTEDVMKVCDICGDAGFEDMLAVCSDCNGAEHAYCYESLMAQVSEGYWQCSACKSKQKTTGDSCPSTDVRLIVTVPSKLPSLHSTKKQCSTGNARSRLSALLQKRRLPSDKKRTLKGALSSQFPAKRSLTGDSADAPPAKKQATEVSSISSVPSSKFPFSRESSFKSPETGKVKFVSPTALMGTSGEGMVPPRGSGKSPHLAASLTSASFNSNTIQSGQALKGRFPSAVNSTVGPISKVNTISQLTNSSASVPLASSGSKALGVSKSSESLPSFLLPSKSFVLKSQPISKGLKDSSDGTSQPLMKEGVLGHGGTSSARTLVKVSSFKITKGIVAPEPKSKNEVNSDLGKSPGSKISCPEAAMVKVVDSKHNETLVGGWTGIASKVEAGTEPYLHSEIHNTVDSNNKSTKQELAGSSQVLKQSATDESAVTTPGRCEAQNSSAVGSSGKDPQVLSVEQDISVAPQVMAPSSLVGQVLMIPEPDTSKETSKNSRDAIQSAPLLPFPVTGVQESPMQKIEEKGSLQLAVNIDTVGEKCLSEKSPTQDDLKGSFTPRSRPFAAWGTPSYVPSLGSTRCYRCKELGHSAKNCISRSSMPCLSSEAVGALKPVSPFLNVDSPSSLKVMSSTDSATRVLQSVTEISSRIKPVTEMAPITKLPSTERVSVPLQALNPTVAEVQVQMQEGQAVGNIASSTSSPLLSLDPAMRKETVGSKERADANFVQSSMQLNVGAPDDAVKTTDATVENDITLVRTTNSTSANVQSGTALPTSAAECQAPPLLPIPFAIKSAAQFPASVVLPSSVTAKAANPTISRYQESLKVYPEAQIVWQGTFEVTGKASAQVSFYGLQANPSNRALPKVREVARKLQPLLPLEELPRGSEHNSWPVQFQKSRPINDNIALYFFASGKESYSQYYKPLVDRLIKFDLTLKGFIEDAELLIFPSNLLPPGSQCWNNFMFLWAVFRARKLPIKQPILHIEPTETKQVGVETSVKLPLQSGVLPWGKFEDMSVDLPGNKNMGVLQVLGNKVEKPSSAISEAVSPVGPLTRADSEVVVCQQLPPCQQEIQQEMEVEAVGNEGFEQKTSLEPTSHQEKIAGTVLPSTQTSVAIMKASHASTPMEGTSMVKVGSELLQKPSPEVKSERVDAGSKLVVSSAVKLNSVPLKNEHGGSEKVKHSTPLMATSPALVCPSPRERQEDVWTPRKLSSDKEKGVRERTHDKSDKIESGRGLSRDRDRDKQRDREKHKERDRDRERSRRHSDYEREKERERGRERDRDKDRERDRERDRDRGRDRERDRERWRDREERDRRGRDWDRDRDKVGERDKGRERGRDRESERERTLTRERSGRHRHWDPDGDYARSSRHWHRHPRSRTPSRSPPGNRDWSPSRPRGDRYHHRYHRSSRHSRSYSPSPDSDHGFGRLQPRAESRDLSKDSFAHKGKSPDIIVAKEESVVKNSVVKDYGGDEQGNFSQRGSNSNSLCRENIASAGRKLPIADLNLSPSEIEGYEEEGLEDEVVMSVEVAKPLTTNQGELTSNCHEYFHPNSRASKEPGECSISAGKVISYRSTEHLACVDERTDSLSHSLVNDSSGPSLFPVSMSVEGSSSCLQFFPQAPDEGPSTPDLNLALGAKELSPPKQGELPLFMQLLEPSQGSLRVGTFDTSLDVPMVPEQADLSLSLAIPEHSKRPVVNTSLRLFG